MKKILFITALLYAVSSSAGTITTSVVSLYNFNNCYINHSATAQWFVVSGSSLSGPVVITAPDHFEVSADLNRFYSSKLTLNPVSGSLAQTKVFVRFSPWSAGSKSGNVNIESASSTTKTIAMQGTGINFTSLSSYYTNSTTSSGAVLKTELYNIIKGHTTRSYDALYNFYPSTDTYYDGTVWDVYSTRVDAASPYIYNHGQKKCGNYSDEGDCYNREHTMPQSWFNSSSPMVSDIHHILPTDGKVNGLRSNYPFGEVSNPTSTTLQGAELGPNTTGGYTGTVFEPVDEYKGDIARGLLYMATRYENLVGGWSGNGNAGTVLDGSSFPAYDQWFLDVLIKWHNQDPPSNREIIRNNEIGTSTMQNNRNPFIDSPQFVQRIWGGSAPAEPGSTVAGNLEITGYTGTSLRLTFKSGEGYRRLVVIRPVSAAKVVPVDNKFYQASASLSSAAVTGTDNYVVLNGTGSTVNISGLTNGVNYEITVYEYNGWYSNSNYRTSTYASITTAPVDVVFGPFTATLQPDKRISLNWSTLSENNNSHFEIERSINSGGFVKTGSVNSAGNSTVTQYYTFNDDTLKNAPAGHLITNIAYRIRQVGSGGGFSISNTQSVNVPQHIPDTVIWGAFNATLQGDKRTVKLEWKTLREQNNLYFEIERGTNNNTYAFYDVIDSKGNSSLSTEYNFEDTSTSQFTHLYYRIRQVCQNGSESYSNEQTVILPVVIPERKDSVHISGFDAVEDTDRTIMLNWTINYQGKAGSFDLLRSINNRPYQSVFSYTGSPMAAPVTGAFNDDTLKKNPAGINTIVYMIRYTGADQTYIVNSDTQMIHVNHTGLHEMTSFNGVIYPVPFNDELNIVFYDQQEEEWQIAIHDLAGRNIRAMNAESTSGNIGLRGLSTLEPGIYLIELKGRTATHHLRVIRN